MNLCKQLTKQPINQPTNQPTNQEQYEFYIWKTPSLGYLYLMPNADGNLFLGETECRKLSVVGSTARRAGGTVLGTVIARRPGGTSTRERPVTAAAAAAAVAAACRHPTSLLARQVAPPSPRARVSTGGGGNMKL
ncbi:hypothetical protein V1477_007790 [Vespula maculifrons]|uniref:Uncharacterized protein n=1 Tax=Vespula maculifrons TaxID=7453 RepID=A0ABD2CG75_VESMC